MIRLTMWLHADLPELSAEPLELKKGVMHGTHKVSQQ